MNASFVLLVEDHPADEMLTIRALRKANIPETVEVARDGVEALDRLFPAEGKKQVLPRVVLLDIKLPRLNGFEVLRKIRQHASTCNLPVVMLTSSDHPADVAQGYQLGANSYVRKPATPKEFQDTIATLGTYWMRLNQPPPQTA